MNLIKNITENKNLKKPVKLKSINISKTLELEYYRSLKALANDLKKYVRENILPLLEKAEDQVKTEVKDSVPQLITALNVMSNNYSNIIPFSTNIATRLVNGLNNANKNNVVENVKSRLGVDIKNVISESSFRDITELMKSSNVSLIKSIPEQFINDIQQVIQNGINQGLRHEEIARQIKGIKDINSTFGKLDNRVKLIARNEVGNINANLTRARYESIGLDIYQWSTSGDEAVRKNHRVLDNKYCKFSDPTVYADSLEDVKNNNWKKRSSIGAFIGNPGNDFNCRCVSLPVIMVD